ncbi:MAG TPA: rhamnan synthesis F family protein [Bosea sp. (in: a-proteobacteria)]|nr:rhamnan synthesis F family protein [Bosea sp. (in: a-proteobacteria)]
MQPRRLVQPAPWVGHLPFAQWLVGVHRPGMLVELGVHTGNSYCSFCEAIDRLGLDTMAFGVDHWLGDPQAGSYGTEVYDELKAHHDPLYGRFSTLLRMDFAAAAADIPDGAVDLLHIDGFHTYEAVRGDFETFERKMSTRGLVLFHDTNVRAPDFGVWRFFGEIARRFPSFEFLHSNGLGVVYVGSEPPTAGLAALLAAHREDEPRGRARAYFARLGGTMNDRLALEVVYRRVAELSGALDGAMLERDRWQSQARRAETEISGRIASLEEGAGRRALEAEAAAGSWLELDHVLRHLLGMDATGLSQALGRLGRASGEQNARDRHALKQLLTRLLAGVPLRPEPGFLHRFTRVAARRLGVLPTLPTLPAPIATASPPAEPDAAERAAIRASGLFDASHYALSADAQAAGVDPLVHYLTVGEALGHRPGPAFDPSFYGRRYPDIAGAGSLRHYVLHGRAEARLPVSRAERLSLPPRPRSEPALLMLVDGGENPLLSPALARAETLAGAGPLIVLARREGPAATALRRLTDEVIVLAADDDGADLEAQASAKRLEAARALRAVLLIDPTLHEFVPAFDALGIPVAAVIDDAVLAHSRNALYPVLRNAHAVLVHSDATRDELFGAFNVLARRQLVLGRPPVLPLPPAAPLGLDAAADATRAICSEGRDAHLVAVIGGETDIALLWALAAAMPGTARSVRFAWLGPDAPFLAASLSSSSRIGEVAAEPSIIGRPLGDRMEIVASLADSFILLPQADRMSPLAWRAVAAARPVVTMQAAGPLRDWLAADPAAHDAVLVPYDVAGAAAALVRAVSDGEWFGAISERLAAEAGPAQASRSLAAVLAEAEEVSRQVAEDVSVMRGAPDLSRALLVGPAGGDPIDALKSNARIWAVAAEREGIELHLRRPAPGFNPLAFHEARSGFEGDPFAQWLREGRPEGDWTHPCLVLEPGADRSATRVAIHGHFHYPDLLPDFLQRLARNRTPADLFLTTSGESEAALLRSAAKSYGSGSVEIRIVPNRGRDIGPFLSEAMPNLDGYDLVLHIHGKKSRHVDAAYGESWRKFLWAHLIGDDGLNALDALASAFDADPKLGLAFPEDPNLHSWGGSRDIAVSLAERMGISLLPRFPEFPVGTMFAARPAALLPLRALGLGWHDYPAEPLPIDGTLLHALERLLPLAARRAGFGFAAVHHPDAMR